MATLYVDYKNGVDTNDGSSGSPLKTLSHTLASHAANGDTILLRGSSAADEIYWQAGADLTAALTDITIRPDTGHYPVFYLAATELAANFAKTGGYTNIYEEPTAGFAAYGVWHGATELTKVADVATCDATPNSFTRVTGVNQPLYINVGGAPTQTVLISGTDYWMEFTGTGVTVEDITVRYGGRFALLKGANSTIRRCTYYTEREANGRSIIAITATGCLVDGFSCWDMTQDYTTARAISTTANNTTIRNCNLSDTQYGIFASVSVTGTLIERCVIHDIGQDGIAMQASGTINDCVVYDCDHACIAAYLAGGAGVLTVNRCVTYGGTGARDDLRGFLAEMEAGDTANFYHCVAYGFNKGGNGQGLMIHITDTVVNAQDCIFANNLLGIDVTPAISITGTIDYNCVYNNGTDYDGISAGAHDISLNPLFVNPGSCDFRLGHTSPCIDAGVAVAGYNEGFRGGAPDIGAFEYVRPVTHHRRG